MKQQYFATFLLTLLIVSVWVDYTFAISVSSTENLPEIFIGVDVAYYNIDEMYDLIDEVSPYTNLFVIGAEGISYNQTKLNETCQYLSLIHI